MSPPAAKPDDVHRLSDMVTEEVSVVDRAANRRKFLIVKRDISFLDAATLFDVNLGGTINHDFRHSGIVEVGSDG